MIIGPFLTISELSNIPRKIETIIVDSILIFDNNCIYTFIYLIIFVYFNFWSTHFLKRQTFWVDSLSESLSETTHSLSRLTFWLDSLSESTHFLSRLTFWVNSLSESTYFLKRLTFWVDSLQLTFWVVSLSTHFMLLTLGASLPHILK